MTIERLLALTVVLWFLTAPVVADTVGVGPYDVVFDEAVQADPDEDGFEERTSYYLNGTLVATVYDNDGDGKPDLWFRYDDELYLDLEVVDENGDGEPDVVHHINREEVVSQIDRPSTPPTKDKVNAYIKLHPSWSGTMFLPDGTKKLVGSFSALASGGGYTLELDHQDTGATIRFTGATVSSDVDLDLTDLRPLAWNKDAFIGIPRTAWTELNNQLTPRTMNIILRSDVDTLYKCPKQNPTNCTSTDWTVCTSCKKAAKGWQVPGAGSYGTSTSSSAPVDVVKKVDEALKWKEIIMALVALGGMGFGALKLAKRKTLGEELVHIDRDIALEAGQIKLNLKVLNHSTFAIRKVEVHLDVPEYLKVKEPSVLPLELGDIEAEEQMTALFQMLPIQRVTGHIGGKVTYLDRKGERATVTIKEVPVPCLCSFMVKTEVPEDEFDGKIEHMETVTRRRMTSRPRGSLIDALKERCSVLQPIAESVPSPGEWVGKYFAKERHSNREFGLVINYRPTTPKGTVDITAFGENRDTITGLAEEMAAFVDFEEENQ